MATRHIQILFFLLLLLVMQSVSAQQINFHQYSQAESLKISKEQNKHILLTFKANWCKSCKWMHANIFTDPHVAAIANENFISIRVDYDTDQFWKHWYDVKSLPTSLIIDSDGEVVAKVEGSSDPLNFKSFLECKCNITTSYPASDPLLASINDLPQAGLDYQAYLETKKSQTKYSIEVASFNKYGQAQQYLESINNISVEIFIQKELDTANNPYYRVYAGRFQNVQDAVNLKEELTRKGYISKVIQYL